MNVWTGLVVLVVLSLLAGCDPTISERRDVPKSVPAAPPDSRMGTAPLRLNGQPFFPLALAGAPMDLLGARPDRDRDFGRYFGEITAGGFNTFFPLFLTSDVANTSAELVTDFIPDTCEARRNDPRSGTAALVRARLAVILPAFIVVEKSQDLLKDKALDETFAAGRLEQFRRCYDGVPIFGYQSYDDAPVYQGEGVPRRKLQQVKQLIQARRSGDEPYVFLLHPVEETVAFVENRAVRTLIVDGIRARTPSYSTGDLADIVGVYIYPVPFAPLESVGRSVSRFRAAQPRGLRPLVGLQGMGQKDTGLHPTARRPNAVETRFMAFHAVVNGAGGLLWWGTNFVESSSELWQAMKRTALDLRQLSPWLVGPDSSARVRAQGLETLLKVGPPGRPALLLAVNPSAEVKSAQIALEPPAVITRVREIYGGRALAVTAGAFTDRVEPWGVRAYELTLSESR